MATEIAFSIPVSGIIRIEGNMISVKVNEAQTTVKLPPEVTFQKKVGLEPGKTLNDIALEAAQEFIQVNNGANRFTAADLYNLALNKYPWLKRNSLAARIIANTPNHPSSKHYTSGRDYFSLLTGGLYELNQQYLIDNQRQTDLEKNSWR